MLALSDDPNPGGRPPVLDEEKRPRLRRRRLPPQPPIVFDCDTAPLANGGSFAPDPSDEPSQIDEDPSSQAYVVEAVQIVPTLPTESAA